MVSSLGPTNGPGRLGRQFLSWGAWLGCVLATSLCAAPIVWTGAGGNNSWNTGSNWQGGSTPATGGTDIDLSFNNTTTLSPTTGANDYKLRNLAFGSSAGAFTLSSDVGKKLIFEQSSGAITNAGSSLQTINVTLIEIKAALAGGLQVGGAGDIAISSTFLSDGGITKIGTGTVTLSGASEFTGALTIQQGTLSVGAINQDNTHGPLGHSNLPITLGHTGGLTGTLHYTGATASSNRSFTLAAGGSGSFNVATAATNLSLSGTITHSGGFEKTGAGTLTLSGTNTFSGGTTVSAGNLTVGSIGALGQVAGALTVSGGTLNLGGLAPTARTGTVSLVSGFISNGTLTKTGGTFALESGTISAVLAGSAGLAKTTAGTLSLSAANTFTGGTTISFGTVATGHTTALGTGTATVTGATAILNLAGTYVTNAIVLTSSGTLSGSGGVGALSASSGGTLSPGNSPGTLTAGNTTFAGGGAYTWESNNATGVSGTNYDLLSISGALTITATSGDPFAINLTSLLANNSPGNVINFNSAQNYGYTIATASGGIIGFNTSAFTVNTSGFSNALNGGTWSLAASGNNLDLTFTASAIPEPSTYAAILGLAALCLAAARRKNRSRSS